MLPAHSLPFPGQPAAPSVPRTEPEVRARVRTAAFVRTEPARAAALFPGNRAAHLFRTLDAAWQVDATHQRVDALAAELAAQAALAPGPLCLGLLWKESVPRFYGLVFLLDGYGLMLRQRYRADGRTVFLFLERKAGAPSEFAGAVVRERAGTSELPRAA